MQNILKSSPTLINSPLDQSNKKKLGYNCYNRAFSSSHIRNFPPRPSIPETPIAPFSQLTDESRTFINQRLDRDVADIEELSRTIENNNRHLRNIYRDPETLTDEGPLIETLTNITGDDIAERKRILESADLLSAIVTGVEPPIHSTDAWLRLKSDLDNSQDVGLEGLRGYVQEVYDTNIRDQWVQNHPINTRDDLPEDRSRGNSEYSDSVFEPDSETSDNESVNQDNDEPELSDNESANQDNDESSDSDSDYSPPGTGQALNPDNNQSDIDNGSNSDIGETPDRNESNEHKDSTGSNPDVNQSADNKESKASYEKLITDDAPDYSKTFQMMYHEPAQGNKSTIDFVLDKQQTEMPDIVDSDGGD